MSDESILVKIARIEERLVSLLGQNSKEHLQMLNDIHGLHKSVNEELTDHQNRIRVLETETTKNRVVRDILIFLGATTISTTTTVILRVLSII